MSKHTKGPWKTDKELGSRNWVISLDAGDRGRGIALAETRSGVAGHAELANARLMAAAPELLEVLEVARNVLAKQMRANAPDWFETEVQVREHVMIKQMDQAIAKAKGE